MYQVLYIPYDNGRLYSLGVYDSESDAKAAIRKAHEENEVNFWDNTIYILYPNQNIDEVQTLD